MLIGCLPFALAFGLLFYVLTYVSVLTFQKQRKRRLRKKRDVNANLRGEQTV